MSGCLRQWIHMGKRIDKMVGKVDILAIGVHPDDIELSCCGTLLKHIDKGYSVGLCDMTQGELGSRGTPEIRLTEAMSASKKMGASFRTNLEMRDGFFQHSEENIIKLIKVIRDCKPEIVLANARDDRHPDHGRASKLISDACFYAGLLKIDTGQEKHRPKAVYHYIQDRNLKADFVVDISEYMDRKLELIQCFTSQFYQKGQKMEGPQTPISSKQFFEFVKSKNRSYARDIQCEYAEAFTIERNIGVEDLFHLR